MHRYDNIYQYKNEDYREGYLLKEFKVSNLIVEGVNPTLDEIAKFAPGGEDDESSF